MSDIFDAAKRSLADDAAIKAKRKAAEEAENARHYEERNDKEEKLRRARQRLLILNSQISDLYLRLKRSGIPPSKFEESGLGRLRSRLARPEGAQPTDGKNRRGGWPLAEVAMNGRRLGAVGGNSWSGTQYGMRDVSVGGQGIVLLTNGELHEYRRLDSGRGIEIDKIYNPSSDLPPEFAIPRELLDRRSGELIDVQTAAIQKWSADLEEMMVNLAKKTMTN
jgi:hypothetical protein